MTVGAATNNFKDIIVTIEVNLLLLRLLNSVDYLSEDENVVEKLPPTGIFVARIPSIDFFSRQICRRGIFC